MEIEVAFQRAPLVRDIPDARQIRVIASAMLDDEINPAFDFLHLSLVNDQAIAQLNARYLGLSGPTNILSFLSTDSRTGNIFISIPFMLLECVLYGQSPPLRITQLLAHGFAHLAGFDHGGEMEAYEIGILKKGEIALRDIGFKSVVSE